MSARSGRQGGSARSGRANSNPPPRKVRPQPPQKTIEDFWSAFTTKYPGKVFNILPKNVYAKHKAAREPRGIVHGEHALKSYEEAQAECVAAVDQISRECRRVNMRYRDSHFDIEFDLKSRSRYCLDGIAGFDDRDSPRPRAVKRVPDIFKEPGFYVDGTAAADVRQGKTGDCYFLAAVGALGNKQGLIDRVCVRQDPVVGVYGFVFYRDGEWFHTVVDDKLYLSIPDYDESRAEKSNWSEIMNRANAEEEYREAFQTGSRALYFAQCNDQNETWLPLLEKAYAKAHGDYYSIIGGFTGEAIEDLTGGVTTELFASDILDKDKFWDEELKHVGKKFLFGCATGLFDDWQDGTSTAWRQGIVSTHAYTILRADEYKGERLVLVRNPWGQAEWSGRWSDGSEQWTAESIQALGHKFGDDGIFWISFKDLLRKYQFFDRTRLFDDSWKITQQWTSVDVDWTADYNKTKFTLTLTEDSPVVIVLSQLDSRYFTGLEGQYSFMLHFRIDKEGESMYEVRSHGNYWMRRSVSTELELEAGTYNVFIKIKADRDLSAPRVEDIVRRNCKQNQDKLLQVGLAYDLAHAKGLVTETEESKKEAAEAKKKTKLKSKKAALKKARAQKYRRWQVETREIERARREKDRLEAHKKKKQATKEAERKANTDEAGTSDVKDAAPSAATTEAKSAEAASTSTAPTSSSPSQPTKAGEESTGDAITKAPSSDAGVVSISSTTQTSADGEASKSTQTPDETEWVVAGKPAAEAATAAGKPAETATEPKSTEGKGGSTNEMAKLADDVASKMTVSSTDKTNKSAETTKVADPPSDTKADGDVNAIVDPTTTAITDAIADGDNGAPPPPAPPSASGSARTILTFHSSVDSLLDLPENESDLGSQLVDDDSSEDEGGDEAADSDNEEFANDPWNAVCVVGLRAYCQRGVASVAVVRPKDMDQDGDTPLDVDDPSKAISAEETAPVVAEVAGEGKAEVKDNKDEEKGTEGEKETKRAGKTTAEEANLGGV